MTEQEFWMLVYRCLVAVADAIAKYQHIGKYAEAKRVPISPNDTLS